MKGYRVLAILLVLPFRSFADNCGDYRDCFYTLQLAIATAVGLAVLIFLLLYVPYLGLGIGIAKGGIEAATGKDLITGSKLENWERVLGIVPGLVLLPKVGQFVRGGTTILDLLKKSGNVAVKTGINQTSKAILKNGYYEVNGFKFSDYYYNKLWSTGRGAPSLVAKEILEGGAKTAVPDAIKAGLNKYIHGGWEMIYNPTTKEVWHLQPIR